MKAAIPFAVLVALASPAAAERAAAVRTDWARGLTIAHGAAAGDLRAPSAAVARVGAERTARERARTRLEAAARKLPVAGGKTVGQRADADKEIARRLQAAMAHTVDLDIDYGSDGSVVVEAALGLDALRAAVFGPDPAGDASDAKAISAVIVDARKLKLAPAIGLSLAAGSERYRGPTIYVTSADAIRKDGRAGKAPIDAVATGLDQGSLAISLAPDKLASARRAGALVVVVTRK